MARLAKHRDTHLTREEIATEALRQFDQGDPPSIRGLAAALKVAPTAIYHHFPSMGAIYDAVVELVWREAAAAGFARIPDPLAIDPAEVLVTAGLVTRRAFVAHPAAAAHLASTTETSDRLDTNLELLAGTFERLGLHGEAAALAFHAYASFTIGSVLLVTARLAAGASPGSSVSELPEAAQGLARMMRLSVDDPVRDEDLFVRGLRKLIAGFSDEDQTP
ncbi:MAG: regulatory protein TetR [Solirubrobacterales bacterium]|jgi:TetR/AcrR family tetracycline transcriptional repressor|nr:regulatory protein TetR [Solirubrobacterales bacterium]